MVSLSENAEVRQHFKMTMVSLKQLPENLCKYELIGLYLTLESIRRLLQIKNRTQ